MLPPCTFWACWPAVGRQPLKSGQGPPGRVLAEGVSLLSVGERGRRPSRSRQKLDDGWPESVEEQGLLLLVWRHNFTNNICKMCYRQSRRGVARQNSEKCRTIVCIANIFTHRRFYTQKLLHTEAFTHRSFYTEAITHKAFTHRSFYIQTLLHTDVFQTFLHTAAAFTHKRFDTQKLLHIDAFTHRHFYTQTLLHTDAFTRRRFYTQKLLHTNAFTHRRFYIQTLLRRNTFTHRRFYTQTVLHTSAFTHNHLYTQTLLHRGRPMYSQRSHRCRGHLSNPTGWCGEVLFPCDRNKHL